MVRIGVGVLCAYALLKILCDPFGARTRPNITLRFFSTKQYSNERDCKDNTFFVTSKGFLQKSTVTITVLLFEQTVFECFTFLEVSVGLGLASLVHVLQPHKFIKKPFYQLVLHG